MRQQETGAAPSWAPLAVLMSGAVAVHEGAMAELDKTYAALGTEVAERGAIGVDGPIREYYLVSPFDVEDESLHRTEVAWPVFRTAVPSA